MLSEKPWKLETVLLLGSAIFFCLFAAVAIGTGIRWFLPDVSAAERDFYTFLANTVGFHGMTLILVTAFLRFHGTDWTEFLGLRQPGLPRRLLLGVLIGALLVPIGLAINRLAAELILQFEMTPEHQPTIKVLQVSIELWQQICFAIAAIGLAPVAEEVLFRGILYPVVKQLGFPNLAVFGTSAVFALIHYNLMTLMPLFVFSLGMIWLYERTDTLLVPILAHAVFNAANFTLFFVERPPGPAFISPW